MTPALATVLAEEVRRTKTLAGRTRAVPTLVNVGTLARDRLTFPSPGAAYDADQGLRADLLTRALERMQDPSLRSVWLTRAGALTPGEDDLRWRAASETAFARHGVADPGGSTFFVLTRSGWLDVGTGEQRTWTRMRPMAHVPAPPASSVEANGSWPVLR